MSGVHRFDVRVYYEDTDAGGIVYHANYLRFAERGRTEWLRMSGFDHPMLRQMYGAAFAVRRCDALFLSPARLDDTIRVETSLLGVEGVRIRLQQILWRLDRRLVTLSVELVLVDAALRPLRIPAPLRAVLEALPGT